MIRARDDIFTLHKECESVSDQIKKPEHLIMNMIASLFLENCILFLSLPFLLFTILYIESVTMLEVWFVWYTVLGTDDYIIGQ